VFYFLVIFCYFGYFWLFLVISCIGNSTDVVFLLTGKPAAGIYGGLHPVKLIISELTRLDAPPIADDGETPAQGGAETSGQLAPNEVVEIDEWILDFAALFREHLGIDAEAHLDLHAEVRGSNPGPIYIHRTLPFFSFLSHRECTAVRRLRSIRPGR